MNKVTKDNDIELFGRLLKKLDIPEDRRTANALNARWFIRTGYVQNRSNPVADEVLQLARKIA